MAAIERQPLATTYSVEVSGWDNSHTFFVERSELCWSEETGKQVALTRRLPPGAMIFVRLPLAGKRARTGECHFQRVLEMCQGIRLRAAQILGIGRTSLYRYLKRDGYDTGKGKSGGVRP